jgi:hypothetical protein
LCEAAAKRVRLDEIGERTPVVDLDHGKPLAIPALELGVAGDVNRTELERDLRAHRLQHPERGRAQVALRRVVEDDASRRYG